LDAELLEDSDARAAGMSMRCVLGTVQATRRRKDSDEEAVPARTANGPIQRGEGGDREGGCACSESSSASSPTANCTSPTANCTSPLQTARPHCKLHVPQVGVELGLASHVLLLQQRPHLRRHARHQVRGGLAGPGGRRRVGRVLSGERAARALTGVARSGLYSKPSGDAESLMANYASGNNSAGGAEFERHELRPVVPMLAGGGALDIGYDAVEAFRLAGGIVVVRRTERERGGREGGSD
jgi:hypothetical protein